MKRRELQVAHLRSVILCPRLLTGGARNVEVGAESVGEKQEGPIGNNERVLLVDQWKKH